jgi:amino acid adenylation domain-containing protein
MTLLTADPRQGLTAVTGQDLLAVLPAIADQLGDTARLQQLPVAILMPRGVGFYASQFAVISKRRFFLPIDPDNPRDRIEFLLEDSRASAVLVDESTKSLVEDLDLNCRVIDISSLDLANGIGPFGSLEDLITCQPNDLAYMIYTSGSTGRPKGVPIHWEAFDNHNQWFIEEFQVTSEDRCAQIASVGFDISLEEIFPSLRAGATLVPVTKSALESAQEFFRWVREEQLTILNIPTALWHNFVLHLSDFELPESVRLVLIGGEKVNPERVKDWFERIPSSRIRLVNAYGPTEVTITSTFCDLSEDKLDSIGKPVRNIDCLLIDEDRKEITQANVPGEVYFAGAGVARGYWNRPEQTQNAFVQLANINNNQKLYRTGDRAMWDEAGDLHFLGRQDNQVKLRGYRIEVDEIATAVYRHEGIKNAVVRKI